MCSISAGLTTAMAGPFKEYLALRKTERQAQEEGLESGALNTFGNQSKHAAQKTVEGGAGKKNDVEGGGGDLLPSDTEERTYASETVMGPGIGQESYTTLLPNKNIDDFLQDESAAARRSRFAHRSLVLVCGGFWVGMAMIPVIFGKRLQCQSEIPGSCYFWFFMLSVSSVFCEVCVVVNTRRGYMFIRDYNETAMGILHGDFSRAMQTFTIVLGFISRFDVFSDIVFTTRLANCPSITWVSVKGHVFHLPVDLFHMSLFTIVVFVFGLQVLPGFFCLARKKWLPMAFKLNEFVILLAVTEADVVADDEPEDDV